MADHSLKFARLQERQEKLREQLFGARPPALPVLGGDGFGIQCKCGHHAPLDEFCKSPAGIDLPPRHYHCHACGEAWTIQAVAPAEVRPSGFVVPPALACVPVTQQTL